MLALVLVTVAGVFCSSWGNGAGGSLSVTERFPPADEALKLPEFRLAGVHYWQGNWNFNFWTNFKVNQIDDDLRQISEHSSTPSW